MAWVRAVFALVCCLLALPFLLILRGKTKARFKKRFMGIGCRLVKLRVIQHGHPVDGPALLISNHQGFLDIIVLQQLEDGDFSFTPKREIARWPVIGWVTSLYDAVYIDRARGSAPRASAAVMAALKHGRRVSIFPEASTSNGRQMLPFKSMLFSLPERWKGPEPLPLQPVALVYRHHDGSPLTDAEWENVAWYGDAELGPYLLRAFAGLDLTAHLVCRPPLFIQPSETRKALAGRLEAEMRALLERPGILSVDRQPQ